MGYVEGGRIEEAERGRSGRDDRGYVEGGWKGGRETKGSM
jgi:hypothetical protein